MEARVRLGLGLKLGLGLELGLQLLSARPSDTIELTHLPWGGASSRLQLASCIK